MSQPEKSSVPSCEIISDASDESVGYIPKGYEFLGEKFLVCTSCNKKLVSVVFVKQDGSPQKVWRAHCTKCNAKSFKLTIDGYKVIAQAMPPYSIIDMDSSIDSNYSEFIVK